MSKFPEIDELNNIFIKHKIEIRFSSSDFLAENEDYRAVEFKVEGKTFNFYVEDENGDIRYNYPLLNLCLVLRELEFYAESDDFLIWCKERYLEPKNEKVLAHFRNLGTIYREVEKILGKIDSQVSDWDFEMGSGPMWDLRKKGIK
ncbi:MAG: hypothetical protein D8M58_14810 [Calditrichaeota bacterium]|nr:MAG: hypothetical protein DWQ03_16050 [Calditrichota bacterium]MBL1206674.1 hypothetical protein [Calditrichota bacterium]NOG46501.1 hypothetical protein [Calditrichota bacterium]